MTATLRTILEQPLQDGGSDLAIASVQLTRALVDTAPVGCDVAALAPAGDESAADLIPGLREVRIAPIQRRELLAAWQLGVGPGAGGQLVHSPTLAAPLVRHDRANDGEQTVVTLWDLQPWEASGEVHRASVAWHRAMMKRVARFADAVVVPTFAHADRVDEEWRLGERIRVIPGAAPSGFRVPTDVAPRARELALPDVYVAVAGATDPSAGLPTALRAARAAVERGRDVVVFHTAEGSDEDVARIAAEAGLLAERLHVRGIRDAGDRAVLLAGADAFIDATARTVWPWRAAEALAVGVPVIALDTPVLRELVGDGGVVAAAGDLAAAVDGVIAAQSATLRTLAGDRGRTFSWLSAADKVWQLHADM